jgi:hypothetical protein
MFKQSIPEANPSSCATYAGMLARRLSLVRAGAAFVNGQLFMQPTEKAA